MMSITRHLPFRPKAKQQKGWFVRAVHNPRINLGRVSDALPCFGFSSGFVGFWESLRAVALWILSHTRSELSSFLCNFLHLLFPELSCCSLFLWICSKIVDSRLIIFLSRKKQENSPRKRNLTATSREFNAFNFRIEKKPFAVFNNNQLAEVRRNGQFESSERTANAKKEPLATCMQLSFVLFSLLC